MKRLCQGMNPKCGVCAILMFVLFGGCTTTRHEPEKITRFVRSYVNDDVCGKLRTLPVRLNLKDCVDKCVMTKTSMVGTSTDWPMPFKKPVEREFKEMISSNFCIANSNRLAKVELKVEPLWIDLNRDFWGTVFCNLTFSTKLLDPVDGSKRPFFEHTYQNSTRCADVEKIVPVCLYEAIQRTTRNMVDDIAGDPELMERLEDLLVENNGPSMDSYKLVPVEKGKWYKGSACVTCNGWDRGSAWDWAMKRIRSRCNQELEIKRSNYSIITRREYDDVTQQWDFNFNVVIWDSYPHFITLPKNQEGNSGSCVLQVLSAPLLSDSKENKDKVALAIKMLISREMKRKGRMPLEVKLTHLERDEDDERIFKAEYECNF